MIDTWKLAGRSFEEVQLPEAASLDAITRKLPEGYYSTFRTYDGRSRVIGLSAHLRRLPTANASLLRSSLIQLLELGRPDREARVRLMETKHGEIYISIEPLKLLPAEIYQHGVRLETTAIQRRNPRAKSTAFISASDQERKHLAQAGVFEALLVKNGRILEGLTSNFFYVLNGILFTAQKGILLGVTRTMVIRAARGRGMDVRYRALELSQLPRVQEAFITSSSRGIVPVIQIDQVKVGQGRVGQMTRELMGAYEEYVVRNAEKI